MLTAFVLALMLTAAGDAGVTSPGFESPAAGWSLPAGYAVTTAQAHTGEHSLLIGSR